MPPRHCLTAARQIQQHQHQQQQPSTPAPRPHSSPTHSGAVCCGHSSHWPREAPCLLLLPPPTATTQQLLCMRITRSAQRPPDAQLHTRRLRTASTQDDPDSPSPTPLLLHSRLWHLTHAQESHAAAGAQHWQHPLNSHCGDWQLSKQAGRNRTLQACTSQAQTDALGDMEPHRPPCVHTMHTDTHPHTHTRSCTQGAGGPPQCTPC